MIHYSHKNVFIYSNRNVAMQTHTNSYLPDWQKLVHRSLWPLALVLLRIYGGGGGGGICPIQRFRVLCYTLFIFVCPVCIVLFSVPSYCYFPHELSLFRKSSWQLFKLRMQGLRPERKSSDVVYYSLDRRSKTLPLPLKDTHENYQRKVINII